MLANPTRRVHAVVASEGWPTGAQRTVTASVHGQVSAVVPLEELPEDGGDLLVVTAPVVFAPGAVAALVRCASSPDRVVTRVMVPGGEPTDVALWSMRWLASQGVDPRRVPQLGLEFDSEHLPHDDPQARAWVRADEVGITRLAPGTAGARWSVSAGLRLWARRATASVRAMLGQVRRTQALARQRRQHSRR